MPAPSTSATSTGGRPTGLRSSCCTAGRTTSTATPRSIPLLAAAGHRVIVPYLRGFGTTRFLSDETVRNGEQAALALDAVALLDALGIERAVVGGFDWGARSADIVAALWPERCSGLVSVSGYLIGSQAAGKLPLAARGRAPVVVPVLLRHRARPRRLREVPTRVREADLADRVAEVALRRRHLRAHRSVLRQSRPRRDRDPQLPLAARTGRRRARVRRARATTRRRLRSSPCPRSRSRATPTEHRIRNRRPTRRSSPARTRTERSRAGSATTFPRKLPEAFADAVLAIGGMGLRGA